MPKVVVQTRVYSLCVAHNYRYDYLKLAQTYYYFSRLT